MLVEHIVELEEHVARIDQGLAELTGLDTRPVEVLLEAIRNPGPVEMVPSERAAELADEFATLQRQVDELEQRLEAEGRGTAGALQRLETARAELARPSGPCRSRPSRRRTSPISRPPTRP